MHLSLQTYIGLVHTYISWMYTYIDWLYAYIGWEYLPKPYTVKYTERLYQQMFYIKQYILIEATINSNILVVLGYGTFD